MPRGEVIIDPFSGQSLSREELDERLQPYRRQRGLVGDFEAPLGLFLQAAPPRDVIARLLRNLKEIHRSCRRLAAPAGGAGAAGDPAAAGLGRACATAAWPTPNWAMPTLAVADLRTLPAPLPRCRRRRRAAAAPAGPAGPVARAAAPAPALTAMKQIPLAIGPDPLPTFDSFLPGGNGAALEHLRRLAMPSAPVYLWGPSGSGKTHLLRALAHACQQAGQRVGWFDAADATPWPLAARLVAGRHRPLRRARRGGAAGRLRAVRRGRHRRRAGGRGRPPAAGGPAAARRPAHAPGLGPRVRDAAAGRGRDPRRAAPRGRPPRRAAVRRGDGPPADALPARPEAPDVAAGPARRIRAGAVARHHRAAAEDHAGRRRHARLEPDALRPGRHAAADRFRPRLRRVPDRARLGRRRGLPPPQRRLLPPVPGRAARHRRLRRVLHRALARAQRRRTGRGQRRVRRRGARGRRCTRSALRPGAAPPRGGRPAGHRHGHQRLRHAADRRPVRHRRP